MNSKLNQSKEELVVEIKKLAKEIAEANSYVGLLAYELKFNALHEKFLILKFLERKRMGFDVFDSPIPPEVEEIENEIEVNSEDFSTEIAQDLKAENLKKETQIQEQTEEILDEKIEEIEEEEIEEEIPVMVEEIEENKIFPEDKAYTTEWKMAKSYPPIQLDFNDKIAFQSQLFMGDREQLDLVIETLNRINSKTSSEDYLTDLKEEMSWENKEEYVHRLHELVVNRFNQ